MKKLTCSYGTTFKFDMIKENGNPVMIIDANMKEYTVHVGIGAGKYEFPKSVVLKDKLYIDSKMKDELLEVLDDFIETTFINKSQAKSTERGFKYYKPKDIYGNTISIQESSNVEPAIWFGVEIEPKEVLMWKDNELKPFQYHSDKILLDTRMHLKMPQAKRMKKIIINLWKDYEKPAE